MTDKIYMCRSAFCNAEYPCSNCGELSMTKVPDQAQTGSKPNPFVEKLLSGNDDVRQPSHYTVGGIETIDYMAAKASPEEFRGHLRLTALKYLSRAGYKDDALKDYRKAMVYLGWLIKHLETGSHK